MYFYGPLHMAGQRRDDQFEHTFSSYVRIRDVALKTCRRWWTIGRSGERGSGISEPAARHDDDDSNLITIIICLHTVNSFKYFKLYNFKIRQYRILFSWGFSDTVIANFFNRSLRDSFLNFFFFFDGLGKL